MPLAICLSEIVSWSIKAENTRPNTGIKFISDIDVAADNLRSPKLYKRNAATEQPQARYIIASPPDSVNVPTLPFSIKTSAIKNIVPNNI